MPRNGSGNFTLSAVNSPVVDGTLITASNFNAITADLSTAITNSIAVNGESVITGNIPMGGYRMTGMGNGIAAQDSATINQTVTALAASTGSSLVGHISSGTGAVATTVQTKLRESVSVKDFGAVGDGTTDDTAAFQKAFDALGHAGGTVLLPIGKYYLASTVNVKSNTRLQGSIGNVGEQLIHARNNNNVACTIYLASTATINLYDAASIDGVQILGSHVRGLLPPADVTAATNLIAAFTGTAITQLGPDVKVSNCSIGGFTQAFSCDTFERTKMDWVFIDCTNGVLINNSYDIARIENVHCWGFLTSHMLTGAVLAIRSGSAFKTTGHFDTGMVTNCFSYGYQIGFDIASNMNVSLTNCFADYNGGGTDNSQIGFKFSGAADQIQMIGCGASAQHTGVYISTTTGEIKITNCNFWGNYQHILSDEHLSLSLIGNHFNYGNWGGTTSITIASTVDGITSIIGNTYRVMATVYNIHATPLAKTVARSNNIYTGLDNSVAERGVFNNNSAYTVDSFYSSSGAAGAYYSRQAAGSSTTPTASPIGAQAAQTIAQFYDGANWGTGGSTRFGLRAAPSAGSTPGGFFIATTPSGAASATDRAILNEAGNFYPATDNAYKCGTTGQRWSEIWAANGTIQTSDKRTKDNISPASLGLDFINKLNPVSYTWKQGGVEVIRQVYRDAEGKEVEGNTEGAIPAEIITKEKVGTRTHWGLIAQEVKQVVDDAGVDFAGWVLSDFNDKDSQQALRYDQFISPLIKAVQELTERVKTLENK